MSVTLTNEVRNLSEVLIQLSINPSVRGFEYIQEAVRVLSSSQNPHSTTKMYAMVGEKFGQSGSRVERCIRSAVEAASERITVDDPGYTVLQQICGTSWGFEKGKPTNGQFLYGLVHFCSIHNINVRSVSVNEQSMRDELNALRERYIDELLTKLRPQYLIEKEAIINAHSQHKEHTA